MLFTSFYSLWLNLLRICIGSHMDFGGASQFQVSPINPKAITSTNVSIYVQNLLFCMIIG